MATLSPSELAALLGQAPSASDYVSSCRNELLPSEVMIKGGTPWDHFAIEFAQRLTARLRPLIRVAVRVQPLVCRQCHTDEILAAHEARSVVSLWQSSHSFEPLALVLSPPLVAAFVERLLGGRSEPNAEEPVAQRPLTDVDHRLANRLVEAARQCLTELANESSFDLTELVSQDTPFSEAWMPDCPLLQATFDLRFVHGGGKLDWLLPADLALAFQQSRVVQQDSLPEDSVPQESTASTAVSGERKTATTRPAISGSSNTRSSIAVARIAVARIAETTIHTKDLVALAVGDVLLTDVPADRPLEVLIDERVQFQAQAGTFEGRKAIQLLAPLTK